MYNHNDLNQRMVLIDDLICILDGTGRRQEAIGVFRQFKQIVLSHFDYEEHCIMTPVLAATTTEPLILTVLTIIREHGEMASTLATLSLMLEEDGKAFPPEVEILMIESLGALKSTIVRHAKLEEKTILPLIKHDLAIRKGIRAAISKFNQIDSSLPRSSVKS